MGMGSENDGTGMGRITEYSNDGSFVASFFLNSQFQLPTDGTRTTVRYIAKDLLALVLATPAGQTAGYQVQANCITRKPSSKK